MILTPKALQPLGGYLLVLVICLTGIDLVIQRSVQGTALLTEATEINSPATVFAKVDALRKFRGLKIAVVGDSLVYGRSLEEHGFEPWREKNLTAALESAFSDMPRGQDTMVMNFGMNGITPSELEKLVTLVMSAEPDFILMDVTLRSFSRDFEDLGELSRPWLAEMRIDPQSGALSIHDRKAPVESAMSAVMIKSYFLYRIREIVQFRLLGAQPKEFFAKIRDKANALLQGVPDNSYFPDELILQLKAQQRYAEVDLNDDNPQWLAYQRLLKTIKAGKQKAVVFYATEKPDIRESLMDDVTYQAMISKIAAVTTLNSQIRFVGPLSELQPEEFLDHVHLTPLGYRVLAARIASEVVLLSQAN